MTPARIIFALVSVLCILGLFFFPCVNGPYPAVHGPVTALLSVRFAARLRAIIRTGLTALRTTLARPRVALAPPGRASDIQPDFVLKDVPTGCLAVLRC